MSKTWKDNNKRVMRVQGIRMSNASGTHKNKERDRQRRLSRVKIWEQYLKDEND